MIGEALTQSTADALDNAGLVRWTWMTRFFGQRGEHTTSPDIEGQWRGYMLTAKGHAAAAWCSAQGQD